MKYRFIFSGLLFLTVLTGNGVAKAQELLTLEEAVRIALENNYDITIARNNLQIDELNASRANAGFYPTVDATLANNYGLQTTRQTQADGTIRERNNARNSNLNYGVGLNWTIFNGFGMFARYDQLKEFRNLGEAEMQQIILTKVGDVIGTYYNLIQQKQQLKAYDTAVIISRERVQTSQNRFIIGKAARLEVLNAQVDLNTDTTNLLRQRELFVNTKILLNEIMARDINTPFEVTDTITIDTGLTVGQLSELAENQNPALRAAIINKRVAELNRKIVRAGRYPSVGVNSGYNFNRSETALGFALQSTGRGLTYGVTASVNLFNGGLQRRNEKIAGIQIESSRLEIERINQNLKAQLAASYQSYLTSLTLVKLEESNVAIARRNMEITLDKYRLGSLTPVEFRDAQLNYLNATVRFGNAQYQAKLAEIALKEIAGNLNL